jgi:hypothetical protein
MIFTFYGVVLICCKKNVTSVTEQNKGRWISSTTLDWMMVKSCIEPMCHKGCKWFAVVAAPIFLLTLSPARAEQTTARLERIRAGA